MTLSAVTHTTPGIVVLPEGSVTSARGFRAGALAAGIKASGKPDLGLLVSDVPCVVAGTFTQNAFPAAPVVLCRERVAANGRAQALVFNSGNANACNGEGGLADAHAMAALASQALDLNRSLVLVASTGVIGHRLPMDRIQESLPRLTVTAEGGHDAARGIMTTDSHPKEIAVAVEIDGREVRLGAMGKGVGMIHPNMATLLAFVASDAALEPDYARAVLKRVVDRSFNMISVDGDTSTNDTCLLFANGLAGNAPLTGESSDAPRFEQALEAVCVFLAKSMARDGEGATKLIQVDVTGATTEHDARLAARSIVRSNLFKAAVHGEDPNWGRILCAAGYSGASIDPDRAALWIGDMQVAAHGMGLPVTKEEGRARMRGDEVFVRLDLGLGNATARAWGCDLTEQYVHENSAYTT
jgi:glutamate N-acetyltransferase / amino-acid N-acetyltransferase